MKKQINFKRKFGRNAPMPHPKFKKRYFEIRPKALRQVSLKRKRNGRRRRRVELCVRRKCKFNLVQICAFRIWTQISARLHGASVNLGHRSLCGCRVRLDECGRDPDPKRATTSVSIVDVARLERKFWSPRSAGVTCEAWVLVRSMSVNLTRCKSEL